MQEVKTEIFDERAILVGVATQTVSEQKAKEYLDELAFLAETAGAYPQRFFIQNWSSQTPTSMLDLVRLRR